MCPGIGRTFALQMQAHETSWEVEMTYLYCLGLGMGVSLDGTHVLETPGNVGLASLPDDLCLAEVGLWSVLENSTSDGSASMR